MGDEPDFDAEGMQFAEDGIDEEWHVGVERLDQRHISAGRARIRRDRVGDADHACLRQPPGEQRVGGADEGGKVLDGVDREVLEAGAGKKVAGKRLEPIGLAAVPAERPPDKADQPIALAVPQLHSVLPPPAPLAPFAGRLCIVRSVRPMTVRRAYGEGSPGRRRGRWRVKPPTTLAAPWTRLWRPFSGWRGTIWK